MWSSLSKLVMRWLMLGTALSHETFAPDTSLSYSNCFESGVEMLSLIR